MHPPNPKYEHVYAIIRIDTWDGGEKDITVTKIVWSRDRAQSEVDRLNDVVGFRPTSRYIWQLTRLEKDR